MHAPLAPDERDQYQRCIAALHAELGTARFQIEWAAGQALPLDQAMAKAVELTEGLRTRAVAAPS